MESIQMPSITSKTTKAELQRALENVVAAGQNIFDEHQKFRKKVAAKATEVKAELDWCDEGFKEAMDELGLEIPSRYRRLTIVADFDLYDGKGPTEYDEDDELDDDDIKAAVLGALDGGVMNLDTLSTFKLESIDEPDLLFVEKVRQVPTYSGGYYI